MNKSVIAIIPARGGSRGIPRKNIRPILEKPLLAYTIEHARQTPAITRVIVSTDDAAIGAVAQEWGAEVISRPSEISGDLASSESALLHALDHLREKGNDDPELVVFLQATSPLRQPDDIQKAIETLWREHADSLFAVSPVHGFIWRRDNKELSSLTYDYQHRQRRQEAPEDLIENGSIYLFKPWVLRQFNNRLGGKISVYRMSALDSFQVDEPGDLEMIESLLSVRQPRISSVDLAPIRLLVLDFDGVMTDNRVLVDQNGIESAWCHRGDGLGIARLKKAGVEIVALTSETVPVARARCGKLGIDCVDACEDKLTTLQMMVQRRSLRRLEVAYVGNDLNDLACMQWVGLPIAVADAVPQVKAAAGWVTTQRGGRGAVREVTDALVRSLRKTSIETSVGDVRKTDQARSAQLSSSPIAYTVKEGIGNEKS